MKNFLPFEAIERVELLAMANTTPDTLVKVGRPVVLACGHTVLTKARFRVKCPRCWQMMIRSLKDGSEDYDGFRRGLVRDEMEWLEDPMRSLNERTDLAGNFT